MFHNFSNFDCRMVFKNLVDKKNDKVKSDNIPKTNEEYISVTYGCIRFFDSYRKKANEKLIFSILHDRREKQIPKDKLGQIVRTADIKRNFSNGVSKKL